MKTVFFDVDTQLDFVFPAGALYVPGAENIVENLRSLALAMPPRIRIKSSPPPTRTLKTIPNSKYGNRIALRELLVSKSAPRYSAPS